MSQGNPSCDIVLPVFNGLTYVQDCLTSILACSSDCAYRLHIVDDCSDPVTANFLAEQARAHSAISLSRNPKNLGFLRSCNIGIAQGVAPYVVLVNSDVIVTPGWLSRLIRCAESDPRIAAVNPFTNRASHINIPLAPGANFYGMDYLLALHAPRHFPDIVTGVGFCLLLRRTALDDVGLFDEVYGQGYCEDSDLCMRLVAKGYRTVVADNVYVYHKGSVSFSDREPRYRCNRKIFDARWADEYERQYRTFLVADPLKSARDLFQLPQRWDPLPVMREAYRQVRRCWKRGNVVGMTKESLRALCRLPRANSPVVTPQAVARVTRPRRLRVTYVLRNLHIAGGVLSVVQLVNELTLLGVEARIVALREYAEISRWKFLTRPIVYRSVLELQENFPESDIAVATHWTTAPWVADLVKARRAGTGAYFVQDYESWFFPETDQQARANVLDTYRLIPHKIVKSEWLKAMLEQDGFPTYKIRLGMDLALFYPRAVSKRDHCVVLAMVRSWTPRRGFPHVVEALKQVKAALPEVDIVVFGEDEASRQIHFAHRNEGVISDQNRLAELYSTADVFLDGSDFQGFGRPALEAMACGAACVLTNVGGVSEYARHEGNCLLVPPKQPAAFAGAILRILRDRDLKQKLVEGGLATVKEYCHKREARETLAYFERIVGWSDEKISQRAG